MTRRTLYRPTVNRQCFRRDATNIGESSYRPEVLKDLKVRLLSDWFWERVESRLLVKIRVESNELSMTISTVNTSTDMGVKFQSYLPHFYIFCSHPITYSILFTAHRLSLLHYAHPYWHWPYFPFHPTVDLSRIPSQFPLYTSSSYL